MLRVTTEWDGFSGAPGYTVLHYDGLTAADAAFAHDATVRLWQTIDQELESTHSATITSDVPVIDPATGDIVTMHQVPEVVLQMSGSGDPLPPSNQMLIRWRTGLYQGGREIRGRTFVPGLRETTVTAGTLPTATVNGFNTVLTTWLGTLPAGRTLAIWSPTNGSVTNVNSVSVWNEIAILRSRRD